MKNRTAFKAAFPYTIPVLAGYLFMGMAFGILLQSKGYHFGWAFFYGAVHVCWLDAICGY